VKFKIAAAEVPLFVKTAEEPADPVVVVPIETVADPAPIGP
jgi:hypothetical protein